MLVSPPDNVCKSCDLLPGTGAAQASIYATLIELDVCVAEGIIACGYAPILLLCRELVAAGFNPASPLEAWRGETLCIRVRSIGGGARLSVEDDRHGTPAFDAGGNASKGMAQARLSRKTQTGGKWLPQRRPPPSRTTPPLPGWPPPPACPPPPPAARPPPLPPTCPPRPPPAGWPPPPPFEGAAA